MSLLERSAIPRPTRKKSKVEVPELGGAVAIRQMELTSFLSALAKARSDSGTMPVSEILAECVVDANDEPIFTTEEWDAWGAQHYAAAMALYKQINDLTIPPEEETAKN